MMLSALMCFLYLPVDAGQLRGREAMAWRGSWIAALVAGALLQRPVAQRLALAAAHLVALWSGLAAVMILRAAGGSAGPVFGFLLALPLVVLVLAPQHPWAAALTGLATSVGGLVTLLEEGRGARALGEWTLISGGLTALAVTGALGLRRVWEAEVSARSEQRQALERLAEADRLALAGQLASGVAHEINSPLSYVSSNVRFARESLRDLLPEGDPTAREVTAALEEASTGAARIARLVKDLRILGSGPVAEDQGRVDLARVVGAAVAIAGAGLRGRAVLAADLGEVPAAMGSDARIAQVVVHLVAVAAEAAPGGQAPITVRTRPRGGSVAIEVGGAGPAPAPAAADGPAGETGGLRLWLCRTAVQEMGGTFEVETAPGGGALYRVMLQPAP